MANILDLLNNEIPDFPVSADVDAQLEFLYQTILELNDQLKAASEDAPVGVSGSFTSADAPSKAVTVTDGIITSIV